jgi:hypothetical protein
MKRRSQPSYAGGLLDRAALNLGDVRLLHVGPSRQVDLGKAAPLASEAQPGGK